MARAGSRWRLPVAPLVLSSLLGAGLGWIGCAEATTGNEEAAGDVSSSSGSAGGGTSTQSAGGAGGTSTQSAGGGGEGGSAQSSGGGEGGSAGAGGGGAGGAGGGTGGAPSCGDGIVDAPEECDGASNAACEDFGWIGGAIPCTPACTHDISACDGCGNGIIEQALGEQCDFDGQGDPLVLATCASLGLPQSWANHGCHPGSFLFDTKVCKCGNGVVELGEDCDGADLGGHTCASEGFSAGAIACTPDCTLDTGACTTCGDGLVDPGEQCDGANLGGHTCASEGFTAGAVACTAACGLDTSGCTTCGNGVVEAGEQCDDNNAIGGDGCSATCQTEIVACDPDGVYLLQGSPISYTCCFGLVSINVSSFIFTGDGAAIASSPSNPVSMTGNPTTCPSGSFSNVGSIAGGCAEQYQLTGTFTGPNVWTGTYSLTFTGPDCSCFGGVGAPCISQVFPVTAQK